MSKSHDHDKSHDHAAPSHAAHKTHAAKVPADLHDLDPVVAEVPAVPAPIGVTSPSMFAEMPLGSVADLYKQATAGAGMDYQQAWYDCLDVLGYCGTFVPHVAATPGKATLLSHDQVGSVCAALAAHLDPARHGADATGIQWAQVVQLILQLLPFLAPLISLAA